MLECFCDLSGLLLRFVREVAFRNISHCSASSPAPRLRLYRASMRTKTFKAFRSAARQQRAQHGGRRGAKAQAVMSKSHLGDCPPYAEDTVQAIREAVAHSTCAPYADISDENTQIINPPWAPEPRTTVRIPRRPVDSPLVVRGGKQTPRHLPVC